MLRARKYQSLREQLDADSETETILSLDETPDEEVKAVLPPMVIKTQEEAPQFIVPARNVSASNSSLTPSTRNTRRPSCSRASSLTPK
jgi:hypothetical protein